jgi:hypothetical protein
MCLYHGLICCDCVLAVRNPASVRHCNSNSCRRTDPLRGQPREDGASSTLSHGTNSCVEPGGSKSAFAGRTGSKRVALAFYGLTRSLKYTVDSIKLNVMDQLANAGYEYDVYLHTYDLKSLSNMRSGETGELNTTEWTLLSPDFVKIDDQVGLLRCIIDCVTVTVKYRCGMRCTMPGNTYQNCLISPQRFPHNFFASAL